MECTSILESAEKHFLSGNLTEGDFTSQIQPCLPQACEQLYGSADFDLAGTGFYYSTIVQVAVFILCGPVQAFISRCLSPHASTSTNLSLARFQSVLDTAYATGTLLAIGIIASCFVRTSLYPIAALERSIMKDLMDLHSMLQNLAMATYIIMKTPAKITRGSAAWSCTGVYICCQAFNAATYFIKRRLDAIPSSKLIQNLCTAGGEGLKDSYPHLHTSEAGGWAPILLGVLLGVALVIVGVVISIYLPKVWAFIGKICSSRIVQASFAFLWFAAALLCIGYQTYHLTATRDGQEGLPVWDLGQVFVIVVWMPTLVQLFLSILMTLTPESAAVESKGYGVARVVGAIVKGLYQSWFGKEPSVVENNPEEKDRDNEPVPPPPNQAQNMQMEEKAPLISDDSSLDNENMARRPSPGAQV